MAGVISQKRIIKGISLVETKNYNGLNFNPAGNWLAVLSSG
jgi:hypothetical protein